MKQATYGNFQVGMVPNPSIEDKGGFEFASGMDIFSEPGVMKASRAMINVTLDGGLTLTTMVTHMVEVINSAGSPRLYASVGTEIWESSNGVNFSLFLTNSEGAILSLAAWGGYILYASDQAIGRVPVGNAASKDDDYITIDVVDDNNYHPMVAQGGTMKIGNGRYVGTLDESFTWNGQALKLPIGYTVKTMAAFNDRLFVGANEGQASGNISTSKATIFEWRGIALASGSALPDAVYTLNAQGIHSLKSNGMNLFAFPGWDGAAWVYTGIGFERYRDIFPDHTALRPANPLIELFPDSIAPYEGSILYSGQVNNAHGVYQVKDGVVAQTFVPSFVTPGESSEYIRSTQLVHSAYLNNIYISTQKSSASPAPTEYYFQRMSGTDRQNNAMCRTLWHRHGTDKFKRHAGIRLNLKPMAANTAVAIAYRTSRDAAFTSAPHTITSANQNKPVMFTVRPRSREIQFKFTYTTSGSDTPEMLSYDPIFETLSAMR